MLYGVVRKVCEGIKITLSNGMFAMCGLERKRENREEFSFIAKNEKVKV